MQEEIFKKQKLEEGIEDVTSPSADAEPELNSTPVPTHEQEVAAGLSDEPSPEEVLDEESTAEVVLEETSLAEEAVPDPEAGSIPELGNEPEAELGAPEMHEEDGVFSGPATQTFTQSQVDEIAGKTRKETREKTLRSVYSRYGVNSEEELDDLFGNAQRYDTLKEQYDSEASSWKKEAATREEAFRELSEQVALLRSGIDENRYDDAKFILKGKGLDVTLENINQELATHPEWKTRQDLGEGMDAGMGHPRFQKKPHTAIASGQEAEADANPTRLSVLGNNGADIPTPELSERDIALKKIFKV